ncbi:MAG: hypothetical protein IPM35_32920 [Myxococcales bacterium]|nr:hypothetical protein [Myxococcales bacterium]
MVWTAGCGGDDGGGGSGGGGTGGSATGGAGGSTGGAAGSATGGAAGSATGGAGGSTGGAAGSATGGAAGSATGGAGGSGGSSGTVCKGEPYSASCKMNDGSSCIDYHGATWTFDIVKQGCEVGGKATVSTTKCALTGTVGGCEHYIGTGTCDVTHYFAPVTTGVAQSTCTGSGSTFYPP